MQRNASKSVKFGVRVCRIINLEAMVEDYKINLVGESVIQLIGIYRCDVL